MTIFDDVICDEFGRFWRVSENGEPVAGPYDLPEEAHMEDSET
jgi:hypothetical protein